jgi:hypothetical protein
VLTPRHWSRSSSSSLPKLRMLIVVSYLQFMCHGVGRTFASHAPPRRQTSAKLCLSLTLTSTFDSWFPRLSGTSFSRKSKLKFIIVLECRKKFYFYHTRPNWQCQPRDYRARIPEEWHLLNLFNTASKSFTKLRLFSRCNSNVYSSINVRKRRND